MVVDDPIVSPQNQKHPSEKGPEAFENGQKNNNELLFSPRFRSVAAMAGWDEEAILLATQVVEDTPERESKLKKRSDLLHFKTPPTHSRRKRRAQRKSPVSVAVVVLDLDEDETRNDESEKEKIEPKVDADTEKKTIENKPNTQDSSDPSASSAMPCIDRLREELSCAICLEICFEPSTTPCGHSFCKKCLRSAADKCGKKCPKCRQLISNGRSCTVNTVLWNTIQLLFPQEVKAREAAGAITKHPEAKRGSPQRVSHYNARNRTVLALNSQESEDRSSGRRRHSRSVGSRALRASSMTSREADSISRRRGLPSQDEDAALALRLQREEFMEAFRASDGQYASSLTSARANLRAMASRAMDIRVRSRQSRA